MLLSSRLLLPSLLPPVLSLAISPSLTRSCCSQESVYELSADPLLFVHPSSPLLAVFVISSYVGAAAEENKVNMTRRKYGMPEKKYMDGKFKIFSCESPHLPLTPSSLWKERREAWNGRERTGNRERES